MTRLQEIQRWWNKKQEEDKEPKWKSAHRDAIMGIDYADQII